MELCLGTVQFGMRYGIRNEIGRQPSWEESFSMLDYAAESGITTIDTARAYGEAELVLGEWIKHNSQRKRLQYISKLRPNVLETEKKDIKELVECEIIDSLKRLGISRLNGYLLHTPEYIYNSKVIEAMIYVRDKGYTDHIGISIYDIKEGEAAIETGVMDYIQMPYSMLDQRGIKTGFLKKCKERGMKTFTRSAFLQGLLLMSEKEVPDHLKDAGAYLQIIREISDRHGVDENTACLSFVKKEKDIDYLVFGVETRQQLESDIEAFEHETVPDGFYRDIKKVMGEVDHTIIFPSLWKK